MKVALVHDWITGLRGGERVLEALCELYPDADIFTLVYVKGSTNETIERHKIVTSILQKIPFGVKKYGAFLPFLPFFAEMLNLSGYDLVVSSSHAVAKNVKHQKGSLHVSYIHSPMRYIWDMFDEYFDRYFERFPTLLYKIANLTIKQLVKPWRWWDRITTKRVDYFVTNSDFVGQRVKSFYNRDYKVINPPVDVEEFIPIGDVNKSDYYIVVSALVPYKRVDLVVEAFNVSGRNLVVVGKGSQMQKLKDMSKSNIVFEGFLPRNEMIKKLQGAKAFIYPQIEDFGITAVESQAAGTPVIAFNGGGAVETVIDGETGLFFDEQTQESLNHAIDRFEGLGFASKSLISHAKRFSKQRFKDEFSDFVGSIKQVGI